MFVGLQFFDTPTAGNATLIANSGVAGSVGGIIYLGGASTGGTARVEVFGNGSGDSTNGTWTSASTVVLRS